MILIYLLSLKLIYYLTTWSRSLDLGNVAYMGQGQSASISIDVFTVVSAILDNTPEFKIQGRIKGRDTLGLRLGRA